MGIKPNSKQPYAMLIPFRSPSTNIVELNTILTHVKAIGSESNAPVGFTHPGNRSKNIRTLLYFIAELLVHSGSKFHVPPWFESLRNFV